MSSDFDVLALPRLMTFLYARDPLTGTMLGFAALRKLASNGFHIDPLIASEDAPKGTTDLLLFSAMAFCNTAGISKLSLGFEPMQELSEDDISGMSSFMSKATRKVHKKMWSDLPLGAPGIFAEPAPCRARTVLPLLVSPQDRRRRAQVLSSQVAAELRFVVVDPSQKC